MVAETVAQAPAIYWRTPRRDDPDAREEARTMGHVPRAPQDDAPEEGGK